MLIARPDPRHEHHDRVVRWQADHPNEPFVTRPLTASGFVGIYGHPNCPGGPGSPASATVELRHLRSLPLQRFVQDSLSLADRGVFPALEGASPGQLTDVCLFGPAAVHGILATAERVLARRVRGGSEALHVVWLRGPAVRATFAAVRALLSLLFCLFVLSCAARQEIDVGSDGSATVSVQVRLQPAFADWVETMDEEAKTLGLKRAGAAGLFDEEAIRRGAASFAGLSVTRFAIPSRERLEMTLALADITALAGSTAAKGPQLIALERSGSRRTLRVHLDAATYAAIKPLVPGSDNELFEVLGPQETDPYTEAEYDDVLAFTVGGEAPKWVRASRIEAIVRVPGRVISQQGGRIEADAVRFEIPLLDVLLLRKPLVYTVEYELAP